MAKRVTVLVSDELYGELMDIKGADETLSLMDLVRAGLRLLIWYQGQKREGFVVCARKEDGGREITREIVIQGL